MRYLFILVVFASCNSNETASPIAAHDQKYDSLIAITDSVNIKLSELDSFATVSRKAIENRIDRLTYQKQDAVVELSVASNEYIYDDRDKRIYDLNKKIKEYEGEISYLKRKIYYDSLYRSRLQVTKETRPETIIEKPDSNSLLIDFDARSKGGELPVENIDVYLIPYTKKAKPLMTYQVGCELKKINELNGCHAGYYDGLYFFNNVQPGKYLIKVCAYYGNFKLIDKPSGKYNVKMQISPPIQ